MILRRVACVLAVMLGMAAHAAAQPAVLEPSGRWVTDRAELLTDQEERVLSFRLESFADTTSTQLIVVTIPSLEGAAASEYAVELGRRWGVGQAGRNNGAVLLVSRDDREVFIATGFGLEGAIPDITAGRIVRDVIVPQFRQGRFYEGISRAVDALMLASAGEYEADGRVGSGPDPVFVLMVAFVILVLLIIILSAARGGGGGGGGRKYRHRSGPVIIWGGPGHHNRGGGWGGGFGGGFGGGGGGFGGGLGGFGGGGGGFGGGGAGGSW